MKSKVVLEAGAYMPEKAHKEDAGYDIRSRTEETIMPGGSAFFNTGVHIEIPEGHVGFLKSKSGLNVKHGLLSTGVIDSGYTGYIGVKLYNFGSEPYTVHVGDKITQLVILPLSDVELVEADALTDSARGEGGFGSTGV